MQMIQTKTLLAAHIQHIAPINLHLLILVILELQLASVLLHAGDFGAVESRGFGITGEYMLSDCIIRKDSVGGGNGD